MKKENAIRYYRKFSAADGYIIAFEYKKENYIITVDELMPRWLRVEHEASSKGGKEKLQLRLSNKFKEQLIRKGATKFEFNPDNKNLGVALEREVYRMNGQEPRAKDNVGFWVSGDITIDGKEYQIKREGAQIVVFETLKKLQECGKNWKEYRPKRRKRVA